MKVNMRGLFTRLCLVMVLVLAVFLVACSTPTNGSATPPPQATSASTPVATSSATATVQPPTDEPTSGDYPGLPATPVITVTIEAYPTP